MGRSKKHYSFFSEKGQMKYQYFHVELEEYWKLFVLRVSGYVKCRELYILNCMYMECRKKRWVSRSRKAPKP